MKCLNNLVEVRIEKEIKFRINRKINNNVRISFK